MRKKERDRKRERGEENEQRAEGLEWQLLIPTEWQCKISAAPRVPLFHSCSQAPQIYLYVVREEHIVRVMHERNAGQLTFGFVRHFSPAEQAEGDLDGTRSYYVPAAWNTHAHSTENEQCMDACYSIKMHGSRALEARAHPSKALSNQFMQTPCASCRNAAWVWGRLPCSDW